MAYGDPNNTVWTSGSTATVKWDPQPAPLIEPIEGSMVIDAEGNLSVYRGRQWEPVKKLKLPEAPLSEIDLDALNTDVKTIKREIYKRVLWLEEKADTMEGEERLAVEDATHYLRSAMEELDRIRGQE